MTNSRIDPIPIEPQSSRIYDDNFEDHKNIVGITAKLISVYLGNSSVSGSDLPVLVEHLPQLIRRIHQALAEAQDADAEKNEVETVAHPAVEEPSASGKPSPAVPIDRSMTPNYVVCLEDGGRFRSLRPHLRSAHGLTPDEYRERWGLAADYPMVAPDYSRERAKVALDIGLGHSGRQKSRTPKTASEPSGSL
jgi:predicted transcriptional regulator